MRLVYANARYKHNSSEGGPAHMRQFIENAAALGHEIFLWHGYEQHPLTKPVPTRRVSQLRFFRTVDLIYYRIEWKPPDNGRIILPPHRKFAGNPLVVWEFNTVPEYGRVHGVTAEVMAWAIAELKRLGVGVDLAICVSNAISEYVRTKLDLRNVMTVPNGSDPELFKPGIPTVRRIEKRPNRLDVVWIGSADLGWHNFDLLRDAARLVWDAGEGDKIVFHVIGPGMKGMRDAPPNVNYYGSEEYSRLPGWLAAMDVGLNVYRPGPADFSSPLKVFDYMASGLTVVSTEQPQVREIFEQVGQTDLLVTSDQPEMLASILRRLAADPDYRRRQGAAGRQLVIDRYNWKHGVGEIFAAIEKLRTR
jgi:glycosyltransferase involved in cell wall biosynthesis